MVNRWWVMVMGGVGVWVRVVVSSWVPGPMGTLAINGVGSLMMGLVYGICLKKGLSVHPAITAGFLGGLTTFSAFSREGVLALRASWVMGLLWVVGSVLVGLGGYALGEWWGMR